MLHLPLLLCLLQSTPAPESLLAPLPAGWRGERLEFPLSFAPELPYRGFEDLVFAPGMFTLDSDSYFSYALALRLEGDVVLDEAALTDFLERYYRGLCSAVATERKLERDASSVHARVWRDEEGFRATVEMFDPFTNGQELDLELELFTHAGPRATELIGLASPLEHEAPIWKELHALGVAWRSKRPAPVFLNHVYFVVEPETYAALAGSDFLRKTFAVSEERTTVRGDLSYTGFYLYGARTYFEFLAATGGPSFSAGSSGLALGVEAPGALDEFTRRLEAASIQAQGGPLTRELDKKPVPWFQVLGIQMPPSPVSLIAMEYDARFLASWHPELVPKRQSRERADVLERYAAALDQLERRASAPFVEVREVTLALDDAQRERVLAVAAVAGWEVEKTGEAGVDAWTCFAPQFRLHIARNPTPGGITGLELELRQPLEHPPLELGRFTVLFHGKRATLSLR